MTLIYLLEKNIHVPIIYVYKPDIYIPMPLFVHVLVITILSVVLSAFTFMFPSIDIVPATVMCLEGKYAEGTYNKEMCPNRAVYIGVDAWRMQQGTPLYSTKKEQDDRCIANGFKGFECLRFKEEHVIIDDFKNIYTDRHTYLVTHEYPTFSKLGECTVSYLQLDLNCGVISENYREGI